MPVAPGSRCLARSRGSRAAGQKTLVRLLLAFFLLWTSTAYACPGDTGERLPPRERLAEVDAELAALAQECGGNPSYLAYRGAVLNAMGKPAEGGAFLEQALLLNPELAGAQIDYAESLAALGDTAGASALIKQLLSRPDVPDLLRPQLERRLNALEAVQRTDLLHALPDAGKGWRGIGSVTFRVGRDTNLNSAPARTTLNLTIPGAEAVLLLAPAFRERSGAAGILEATGQAVRSLEGGAALHLYGEGRIRSSSDPSDTNYQQAQLVGAYSHALDIGEALVSVGSTHLQYGGEYLYQATRLGLARDWRAPTCRPRLGVETEWRRYPAAPVLDGQFYALGTGAACYLGPSRLSVIARAGVDYAQRDRPGGDQRLADLRVTWVGAFRNGSVLADLIVSAQRDRGGYSPLLENNAVRRIDRASLHLEYAHPLSSVWSLVATYDVTVQRSNLQLFDITGRAVYFGIRWQSRR